VYNSYINQYFLLHCYQQNETELLEHNTRHKQKKAKVISTCILNKAVIALSRL